jgi:hypothetical protein
VQVPDDQGHEQAMDMWLLDHFLEMPEGTLPPLMQQALLVDFKQRHPGWKPDSLMAQETLAQDPWYHALQAKYGYAVTCHKAQGGEWPVVWIDFEANLGKGLMFRRWAYTAITRARTSVTLVRFEQADPAPQLAVHPISKLARVPERMYFLPPLDPQPGDPPAFFQFPFLKRWYHDLTQALAATDTTLAEVRYLQYAVRLSLVQGSTTAVIDLVYGQRGISYARPVGKLPPDESLLALVAMPVLHLPPPPAYEPHQAALAERIQLAAEAAGALVTGSHHEAFQDIWYIQTAGAALLQYAYDSRQRYTTLMPKSTLGEADTALSQIITFLTDETAL